MKRLRLVEPRIPIDDVAAHLKSLGCTASQIETHVSRLSIVRSKPKVSHEIEVKHWVHVSKRCG